MVAHQVVEVRTLVRPAHPQRVRHQWSGLREAALGQTTSSKIERSNSSPSLGDQSTRDLLTVPVAFSDHHALSLLGATIGEGMVGQAT
jgi:hypothetical protein